MKIPQNLIFFKKKNKMRLWIMGVQKVLHCKFGLLKVVHFFFLKYNSKSNLPLTI